MDRLPPIPIPVAQLWREFRIRLAPLGVFAVALVAVMLLWRDNVVGPNLVGEVEAVQSNISSPKAGQLAGLSVLRLQRVRAGDVIAQVITTDPKVLQSSLAVIQAEIKLLRVNLEPVLGQQRYALNFDRLRLDWMDQRVQLATAKVHLQLAEADLRRDQELFAEKVVSQQVLDSARNHKESLETEVKERTALVAALEAQQQDRLKQMGPTESSSALAKNANPEDVMQASIKVQEEKLRLTELELSPIELTVPIDGTITSIHHRSGEAVVAGEAIVTLTALTSDRILSYLRPPLFMEPKVGMAVEVRARSFKRCVGHAAIIQVGSQMEPISANLSPGLPPHTHQVGLPVLVSLPAAQRLLPGEIVDLRIVPPREDPPLRSNDAFQAR
jgi:multidrug resistance efflux pump